VWTKQFGDVLSFMTQSEKNNTRTRLQIQFEVARFINNINYSVP
jgi:hypothetical protein